MQLEGFDSWAKEEMRKVSVIVAVYNALSMMDKMISSLQKQDFEDFEIIIVDDGSTDGTGIHCDELADRDPRIRVIHQNNQGVSAARQKGMECAVGEYIIHADADDYVEDGMLSSLYKKAKETDADVVFCDYYADEPNGEKILRVQKPSEDPLKTLILLLHGLHGSCWNKLIKRSTLIKYKIKFPEGLNYCEDLITWVQLFQHPEVKIAYLNKAYYHYVANPESVTRRGSVKMLNTIRLFTEKIKDALPKGNSTIDRYISTLPIAPFQYAFQHKLVSDKESRSEYKRLRKVIWSDTHSNRWRLGYIMMELNMMSIARKLIIL